MGRLDEVSRLDSPIFHQGGLLQGEGKDPLQDEAQDHDRSAKGKTSTNAKRAEVHGEKTQYEPLLCPIVATRQPVST